MCFKTRAANTETVNTGLIIMVKTCYAVFCFLLISTYTDSEISRPSTRHILIVWGAYTVCPKEEARAFEA